jgi:hypothetical protein
MVGKSLKEIIISSDHFVLREGIDELIVPQETLLGLE